MMTIPQCKMVGRGGLLTDSVVGFASFHNSEGHRHDVGIEPTGRETELTSQKSSIPSPEKMNDICWDDEKYCFVRKEQIVSSSMIIFENFHTPYAVVYGFHCGEIEVARFGRMDCTIRVCDLDSSNLITVLHHSMFDNFCKGITINSVSGSVLNGDTSASSFLPPIIEDSSFSQSHCKHSEKGITFSSTIITKTSEPSTSQAHASEGSSMKLISTSASVFLGNKHPVKCSCPFPGIATLPFDLASLMSHCPKHEFIGMVIRKRILSMKGPAADRDTETPSHDYR